MVEQDRSAITRPARFVVEVDAGLAWAWIRNAEPRAAALAEGSLVLEQLSVGWTLQFAGAAAPFPSAQRPLFQARFPDTRAPESGVEVRIHRCTVLETHLPLKRWS